MKPMSSLNSLYLSTFAAPACDRVLYRTIRRLRISSMLEIGVGDATRATKLIRMAQKYGSGQVRYTGVDAFEGNPSCRITLKDCHQKLNALGARIRLVPGDLASSILQIAISHVRTDMLIISSEYHTSELEQAWYYVPRMLHAASVVFLQDAKDKEGYFEQIGRLEIERIIKHASRPASSQVA